ncbi:MAG TPA: FmdB family zinc ribbon protein [Chloroflexota bacterium]|nr:FmdB family zinc ribbon protein [Chloroflexota bacterium]
MPIYVYQCADCDTQIEKRQGFADAPLTTCETCGGSVRRLLQPVGIIFKGSGFYSTDYRGGTNGKQDSTNGEAKSTSENGTTTASEAKKDSGDKATASSGDKASANGSASSAPAAASGAKS